MQRVHVFSILSLALLAACADSGQPLAPPDDASFAAITETQVEFVPFAFSEFVPCADGGAGEVVDVSGTLHRVFHVTENANGFHVTLREHPQGASGTGQTTGDTYRATGGFTGHLNVGPGSTETVHDVFRLVGPGPDNNLSVRETLHITVNANGELVVDRNTFSIECS